MYDPSFTPQPPEVLEHDDGSMEILTPWVPAVCEPASHRQTRVRIGEDYVHVDIRLRWQDGRVTCWHPVRRGGPEDLAGYVPLPITPHARYLALLMIYIVEVRRADAS